MIKRWCCYWLVSVLVLGSGQALANDAPPGTINSVSLSLTVGKHVMDYLHWRPIGICVWTHHSIYRPITITTELDEYLPDLVVTVFNESGDDPWTVARLTLDPVAQTTGSAAVQHATGDNLTDGRQSTTPSEQSNDSLVTKSVDVVGSPLSLLQLPFLNLRPDTVPFSPYYQSALDALPSRSGLAEAIRLPETLNLTHYFIGADYWHHWAYEFPRSMSVDNNNDFIASMVMALRAADIVTNKNTLHIVHSANDSCGKNCAVANVIEETQDDHEIWQEVYPHDRHVHLGATDSATGSPLGQADEQAGHGNYVFVIWRHYRGCVQSDGHFWWATQTVNPTVKR